MLDAAYAAGGQEYQCQSLDAYRTVQSGLPRPPAEGPASGEPGHDLGLAVRGLGTSRRSR